MMFDKYKVDEEKGEYNGWTIIKIPALDSEGLSYCEEIKSTEEYLETRQLLDAYIWEAEYMQNPIESKGLLYPPKELNYYEVSDIANYLSDKSKQDFDGIIGYTDIADEGADWLASGTLGIIGKKYYLLDVLFTQDPIEVTQPLVAQMVVNTEQVRHRLESNNGGKGFGTEVKRLVRDVGSYCSVKWKHQSTNKVTRILMHSGIIKEFFYFRTDYEVGSDYDLFMRALTGYVRLGKNKHDDAPDMATGLAEMVARSRGFRFLTNKKAA